jgi:hypothetical protein
MWNIKCFVIPVIIVATGIVSKSLQKYLETIPGQHSIDSLQKLPYYAHNNNNNNSNKLKYKKLVLRNKMYKSK